MGPPQPAPRIKQKVRRCKANYELTITTTQGKTKGPKFYTGVEEDISLRESVERWNPLSNRCFQLALFGDLENDFVQVRGGL